MSDGAHTGLCAQLCAHQHTHRDVAVGSWGWETPTPHPSRVAPNPVLLQWSTAQPFLASCCQLWPSLVPGWSQDGEGNTYTGREISSSSLWGASGLSQQLLCLVPCRLAAVPTAVSISCWRSQPGIPLKLQGRCARAKELRGEAPVFATEPIHFLPEGNSIRLSLNAISS